MRPEYFPEASWGIIGGACNVRYSGRLEEVNSYLRNDRFRLSFTIRSILVAGLIDKEMGK